MTCFGPCSQPVLQAAVRGGSPKEACGLQAGGPNVLAWPTSLSLDAATLGTRGCQDLPVQWSGLW